MKKDTHTISGLNDLIDEKLAILQNGETVKEKREARKQIIMLEKLIKDVNYKIQNGKHYPEHEVPPKTTKEELLKLIDSVEVTNEPFKNDASIMEIAYNMGVDLSGVSVGKNRFEFVELG